LKVNGGHPPDVCSWLPAQVKAAPDEVPAKRPEEAPAGYWGLDTAALRRGTLWLRRGSRRGKQVDGPFRGGSGTGWFSDAFRFVAVFVILGIL